MDEVETRDPDRPDLRRRARHALRELRHWIRDLFVRPLAAFAVWAVPRAYLAYMHLVWSTSEIDPNNFLDLKDIIRDHDGAVGLLWHEEVFTVAYAFGDRGLDFSPHTLASVGTSGEIITRMLRLCGFVVFRGGSSRKSSRRRSGVVEDMAKHMKETRNVIYGITVDGSQGPAYRMKRGGAWIARECDRPVILARTWYRRCIRLPTWDRTAIPLPFNRIKFYLAGPYPVPEDAHDEPGLQRFLFRLEDDLIDMAAQSYRDMGQPLPANLVKRTPEEREQVLARLSGSRP